MIQLTEADRQAIVYFAGLDAMGSLPALDLRMIHGERCRHCTGGPSTRIVGRMRRGLREWHELCATCHRPWESEPWGDRCILRSVIQVTHRTGATEDRLVALAERMAGWRRVKGYFERRPSAWTQVRWSRTLLWWRAWLPPVSATYSGIAKLEHVHPDTVEDRLRQVRRIIERRVERPASKRRAA